MRTQGKEPLIDRVSQWLDDHVAPDDILEALFEILFETLDAVF